ncbi:MAG: hypothetical protein E6Q27_07550 [Aeromicrobium sp.]|nr:MAG: hypothetical protein E6Q27_07550 [Aeromicrobium sp.]
MVSSQSEIYGERTGHTRNRRGRAMRGPLSLPGPFSPSALPIDRRRRREFESIVIHALNSMSPAISRAGVAVEVAVENAPLLPETWTDPVPASILNSRGNTHTIVMYRLPITQRAASTEETVALVAEVLAQRVAEVLNIDPEDLLPRK